MHPDKALGRKRGSTAALTTSMSAEARSEMLEALSSTIAQRRDEAMEARKVSGIEETWKKCEEAYLGIDDANRHEWTSAKWAKPISGSGGLVSAKGAKLDDNKSTAFVRLTSRYVDAGSAKLSEILLPVDDKAFSFKAMPVPDQIVKTAMAQGIGAQPGMPAPVAASMPGQPPMASPPAPPMAPPAPGQPPAAATVPGQAPVPAPVDSTSPEDAARIAIQKIADDAAARAEKRVYTWMLEAKYPAEARKVAKDAARVGVGVLMGVVPEQKTRRAFTRDENGNSMIKSEKKIVPGLHWIDYEDVFPADGCGENVHDGDYLVTRDKLSRKALTMLKGQPGYLKDRIDRVLAEGPNKSTAENSRQDKNDKNNKRFEVWYYYGTLTREEMAITGAVGHEDLPDDQKEVYAIVTMVNNTIIRVTISPLDSGRFPIHVMCWSRRPGHWAGVGVGEQIDMPQRAVNAATRAIFNNAGISAGVQIIIDEMGVVPADGNRSITPNKLWLKTSDSSLASVRDVMAMMEVPNVTAQLMPIIEYGMKLAEESSGIPLITQGQTGPTSPETFGQAELQDNNSHTWIRQVGYTFDDQITEPLVDQFFEYLLLDSDVPDDEKAEFEINSHGSVAMVERAIQEQTLLALLNAAANPAFRIDPAKLMAEYLTAKRLDPRKVQYSAEKQEQMDAAPPPPPVQIAIEQLKGQNALQVQQAKSQAALQIMQQEDQAEQQRLANGQATPHMANASARIEQERIRAETSQAVEASRAHAEEARADKEFEIAQQNGQFEIQKMQLQKELALLQYAHENNQTLQQVKAELANTAMQEQTKRQLAAAKLQLDASENDKARMLELHKHTTSLAADRLPPPSAPVP